MSVIDGRSCQSDLVPDPINAKYTFDVNNPTIDLFINLDASSTECSFIVDSISTVPVLEDASHLTITNGGVWVNDDLYRPNLWSKVDPWIPPKLHISGQLPEGTYSVSIFFLDSSSATVQLDTQLEIIDKCYTTGLTNVPSDGDQNFSYSLASPDRYLDPTVSPYQIRFPGIGNGFCKFKLDFYNESMNELSLASYGLTYYEPAFNTSPTNQVYTVAQDAYLTIYTDDRTLHGVGLQVNVRVTSLDVDESYSEVF